MANDNTKLQYIIELLTQGDAKKATEELGKLAKSSEGASKGMASAKDSAKQLFAFLGGTALIKQSLDSFIEAERIMNALAAALEQTKNNAPGVREEILSLADALGDDLKVQADDVVKVMTQLISFGANPRDLKRLTESVFDLSEVMGRDVGRAARGMSQALKGNFEVFQQLGIEVDKTKLASDGFREAYEKMTEMIGGRGRKSVQGVAGDVQALKVTLEDAMQQLGKWEAAVLTKVASVAESLADLWTRPDLEKGITQQKEAYNALADAMGRAILRAEKLGEITKEQAAQMFGRLGGAREILSGGLTDFGQTTSDEELRAIKESRLPQAGALLQDLRQRLNPKASGAGADGTPPAPPPISSPGLSDIDFSQIIDQWNELADVEQKAAADQLDSQRFLAREIDTQLQQQIEAFENGERIKQDLVDQTVLTMLDGEARVIAEIEINHEERLRQIEETKFETQEQYDEAIALEKELTRVTQERFEKAQTWNGALSKDMEQIAQHAKRMFANGLGTAIVDSFEEGGKAFQKFAANFMRQIAEMILQAIIFRALFGSTGYGGLIGGLTGGGTAAAQGGQFVNKFASGGMAGVSDVNSATYFPKFNVLAGEAGREVMTVLARPSFQRINGVPMQVGMAGGNRLAIGSVDALANSGGGGAGGHLTIEVRHSKDSEVRILENSVQRARVAIVQDMSNDTQLSRVTRQKVS